MQMLLAGSQAEFSAVLRNHLLADPESEASAAKALSGKKGWKIFLDAPKLMPLLVSATLRNNLLPHFSGLSLHDCG
jgi:hypothetical protein